MRCPSPHTHRTTRARHDRTPIDTHGHVMHGTVHLPLQDLILPCQRQHEHVADASPHHHLLAGGGEHRRLDALAVVERQRSLQHRSAVSGDGPQPHTDVAGGQEGGRITGTERDSVQPALVAKQHAHARPAVDVVQEQQRAVACGEPPAVGREGYAPPQGAHPHNGHHGRHRPSRRTSSRRRSRSNSRRRWSRNSRTSRGSSG